MAAILGTFGLGFAGAPALEFAEPDFQQRWITAEESENTFGLASGCTAAEPQDSRFPQDPAPLWFHDGRHGQFDDALAAIDIPHAADAVRVAHLDTGYDPAHHSLPERLETALQRNFVDAGRAKDASDDTQGPLNNLGHGTGTLSILAGKTPVANTPMGAAPFVRVVPIRVADRVVLFSNSAIARAFDYVHELCRDPGTRVDIVTMSMGGLASRAWAEAVNALYEAGVFVVTAAGNNFGNLPTRNIVFPARFCRVVAACGVMANQRAYADLPLTEMAGNYGPPSKMATAVAAYSPNGRSSVAPRSSISTAPALRRLPRRSPRQQRFGSSATRRRSMPIRSPGCGSRRCAEPCFSGRTIST